MERQMVGSMKSGGAMSLEDFARLAEIWGGDLDCWPAENRAEATSLAARSPDAAEILEGERLLDSALDADPAPVVSAALSARLLADASSVATERRQAVEPARPAAQDRGFWGEVSDFVRELGGRAMAARLAGVATAAAAAGFYLGLETQSISTDAITLASADTIFVDALMPADEAESEGVFALADEVEL